MYKRMYVPLAILAILALALSACADQAAVPADVDYWPWNWGNSTLEATLARGCTGLPAGSSVPVNEAQVPCPGTEAASAPVAAAPDPVVTAPKGECKKDALTASHDDNLVSGRYEMSYFGGTSEACYMFGEFNFGVADQTWLVIVPPGWTLNLAGFVGETMWYRESEGAVAWSVTDSTANLTRPDGRNEKTPIVVWVNNPDDLKLLQEVAEEYEVIPPAK